MYPHIFEGWSLFSPDAPLSDETVCVDAVTRDGRHVDPYNEVGSRVSSLPVESVPVRLGHDSFWCDYTLRIPDAGAYHQALIEWILRYPERTGTRTTTDRPLRRLRRSGRTARSRVSRRCRPTSASAASCTAPRTRREIPQRSRSFRRYFVGQYMTIDARSLGFGRDRAGARPAVRSVCAASRVLTLFYSNDGLIPNHMMLWRPPTQWMFSFFFIAVAPG